MRAPTPAENKPLTNFLDVFFLTPLVCVNIRFVTGASRIFHQNNTFIKSLDLEI